jgi:uncharacterized protein involved in copper resistance
MIKSLSKVLVVAAMLIAFVGQALAYSSMSCEISNESHQSHAAMDHSDMDHENMDHANMGHASMNHDSLDTQEDCCDTECICPTSACMSLSIVGSAPNTAFLVRLSEGVTLQPTNQTKSISTSLYRPPIFA